MFERYDDIMTIEDLMEALIIGRSKAYELLRNGQIKSLKMKVYRIPKAAVKEYVLSETGINTNED